MTPTQQIIPGPRLPEGRNSGRGSAIELSHPIIASRPRPEASVNYSALLRRHRKASFMASAFVFPSLAEGFGLPLVEAFQFGYIPGGKYQSTRLK